MKKFLVLLIILGLAINIAKIGRTKATFNDDEKTTEAAYDVGTLSFSLNSSPLSPQPLMPGISATQSATITNEGSLPFKYNLSTVKSGGDDSFCSALNIKAEADGVTKYDGSLLGLTLSPALQISGPSDDWKFTISMGTSAGMQSKSCEFNFVYKGWQVDSDGSWGFVVEKIIINTLVSGNYSALAISNVNQSINTPGSPNDRKAVITWDTNRIATGNLKWRTSLSDPWTLVLPEDTSNDTTSHTSQISGLTADTTYYFRLESDDLLGDSTFYEGTFATSSERSGVPWTGQVVLNEFLPNPTGDDAALIPNGEWVEIYNKSDADTFDLNGWYLTDGDGNKLNMTLSNTITSDLGTPGLNIGPHEFFVVYRNGDLNFDLDNSFIGDDVRLYDVFDNPIDNYPYSSVYGDEVLENKSYARYPDGDDNWLDPIPTPLGPNTLENPTPTLTVSVVPTPTPEEIVTPTPSSTVTPTPQPIPEVIFSLDREKRTVSFSANNIKNFINLNYEITYDAKPEEKGIGGSVVIYVEDSIVRDNLLLGTCSTGGIVCTYDEGMTKIKLKITLIDSSLIETVIEKEIIY